MLLFKPVLTQSLQTLINFHAKFRYKIIAIYIAEKYFSSLNTPTHDMLQHTKGI